MSAQHNMNLPILLYSSAFSAFIPSAGRKWVRSQSPVNLPKHPRRPYILTLLASALLALATQGIAAAQTFTTLHRFRGTDGTGPDAALIQATNGDLFGTTAYGGPSGSLGTIFGLTASGGTLSLYDFPLDPDHVFPNGLIQGVDGNFYGTTELGGANGNEGSVLKVTLGGILTTLYSFCAQSGCADGSHPQAALVQGNDGSFYGTTAEGGLISSGQFYLGAGTVFKITPSGTLTTLHMFDPENGEGGYPVAGLLQATNGDFYGTTYLGGANGGGTVFKITPSGTLTTLHNFPVESGDGAYPTTPLILATDGNLYGTTSSGGTHNTLGGTVFKITPGGTLTTLYSFCARSACGDGQEPSSVIQATDGNFYGTTLFGGNGGSGVGDGGDGTVFELTPGGTLTTLYRFCGQSHCADGKNPAAPLVQDTNGSFYGTTEGGGYLFGTVFKFSVGLGPFVKTLPLVGTVGSTVKILGTNLTGTTSVSFNGISAAFTAISGTQIAATVPAGATTGQVQLVTPGGPLLSNVLFVVR